MKQPRIYYAVDKEDVDLRIDKIEYDLIEASDPIIKGMLRLELEFWKHLRTEYPVYTDNDWHK